MKDTSLILTIGPKHDKPWWWEHIENEIQGCFVKYVRIATPGNIKEGQLTLRNLPRLSVDIGKALKNNNPEYVYTFECGWASIIISAMQLLGYKNNMRHVILQFIMREKDRTIKTRLKYFFMRIIFSSVHIAVCSSSKEVKYYQKVFHWNEGKTKFIPFHTDPKYLNVGRDESGSYIISAGRTFRDYDTFLRAVEKVGVQSIIVGSPEIIRNKIIPNNVSIRYDITINELSELMRKSILVVVPLEDRSISTGQSVFLQAMAMGKAVVATRTAGTLDYIRQNENGVLIDPGDSESMADAIRKLLEMKTERYEIGRRAKNSVKDQYLPCHYVKNLIKVLSDERYQ